VDVVSPAGIRLRLLHDRNDGHPILRGIMFGTRLKDAVEQGVLLSVKWLVGLVLVGLVSYGAITDYLTTRAKAQQGAAAFEYLQKAVTEQQKAQASSPTPTK
jgi:hypothetical protein